MNKKWKIYFVDLVLIAFGFAIASYTDGKNEDIQNTQIEEQYLTKKTDYTVGVASAEAMELSDVENWMNGYGYYYYIESKGDNWSIFLFLPRKQSELANYNSSDMNIELIEMEENELRLEIKSEIEQKMMKNDIDKPFFIVIEPPYKQKKPNHISVFWNGDEMECSGVSKNY